MIGPRIVVGTRLPIKLKQRGGNGHDGGALALARLQRERAQAALATLELEERRGTLLRRDETALVVRKAADECRAVCERMPRRHSHELVALTEPEAFRVMRRIAGEMIGEIYAAIAAWSKPAPEPEAKPEPEATSDPKATEAQS